MSRRAVTSLLIFSAAGFSVVLLATRALSATRAPGSDDVTFRNDVRLVLVDVAVEDAQGNFVSGLSRDNFQIEEGGKSRPITVFENQDAPVTMGILVDESYSTGPIRTQVLAAAEDLIKESNRQDELFVLNFNDQVRRGLPDGVMFSDSIPQLRSALNRAKPAGKTALFDAVADGLKQLESGKRGVKTLVIISDGGDNASQHTRKEVLEMVQRSIATIFTVGLFGDAELDADPALMRKLASIGGGEALFPHGPDELASDCRRIAKDIRARYTLGYAPPPSSGGDGLRHFHIRVSAPGKQGLKVLARESYRYDFPKN